MRNISVFFLALISIACGNTEPQARQDSLPETSQATVSKASKSFESKLVVFPSILYVADNSHIQFRVYQTARKQTGFATSISLKPYNDFEISINDYEDWPNWSFDSDNGSILLEAPEEELHSIQIFSEGHQMELELTVFEDRETRLPPRRLPYRLCS